MRQFVEISRWNVPKYDKEVALLLFTRLQKSAIIFGCFASTLLILIGTIIFLLTQEWEWLLLIFVALLIHSSNNAALREYVLWNMQQERSIYERASRLKPEPTVIVHWRW